jgi:hypothetical protein
MGELGSYQELSRVGYKSKQGNTKELLINRKALQDNIHSINQNLSNDGVQNSSSEEDHSTLGTTPVGGIVAMAGMSFSGRGLCLGLMVRWTHGSLGTRACTVGYRKSRWLSRDTLTGGNSSSSCGNLSHLAGEELIVGIAETRNVKGGASRLAAAGLRGHNVWSRCRTVGSRQHLRGSRALARQFFGQSRLLQGLAKDALVEVRIAHIVSTGIGDDRSMSLRRSNAG